jgi:hypothetical protein
VVPEVQHEAAQRVVVVAHEGVPAAAIAAAAAAAVTFGASISDLGCKIIAGTAATNGTCHALPGNKQLQPHYIAAGAATSTHLHAQIPTGVLDSG